MCDVPAPSQIFGHIVYSANIQGILYQSKYTDKKCLVIFPENFKDQDGHIELSDSVADGVGPIRLDRKTWQSIQ